MDIEPLKALADTEEEEDYESGPPHSPNDHNYASYWRSDIPIFPVHDRSDERMTRMVTVECEHSPIYPAHMDDEGLLTLDFSVMQSVMEWHNSLTKDHNNQAYFLPDQRLFVFPVSESDWETFSEEPDGTWLAPDWLELTDGCLKCLTHVPCDCEWDVLSEHHLKQIESRSVMGYHPTPDEVRSLIYMIRELEAQLKVEQED